MIEVGKIVLRVLLAKEGIKALPEMGQLLLGRKNDGCFN